jgi:transcriptional regulator with XRE-family HTH domain
MTSRKPGNWLRGFGERLRRVREAHGYMTGRHDLTQYEFADDLGIPRATYGRYDRGEVNPSMEMLERIRRVTGISLDFLVCNTRNGFDGMTLRDPNKPITVGERLTWARETQWPWIERVARVMGVTPLQWQRWEEDLERLPSGKAREFAHRFSVSEAYLYEGRLTGIGDRVLTELLRAHPELQIAVPAPPLAAGNDSIQAAPAAGDTDTATAENRTGPIMPGRDRAFETSLEI